MTEPTVPVGQDVRDAMNAIELMMGNNGHQITSHTYDGDVDERASEILTPQGNHLEVIVRGI